LLPCTGRDGRANPDKTRLRAASIATLRLCVQPGDFTMRYFQCTLRQGTTTTIGWIEERGARVGVRVDVPELGGLWDVVTVDRHALPAAWLHEKQRKDRKGMPDI